MNTEYTSENIFTNNSQSLLNEITKIVYFLYQSKEVIESKKSIALSNLSIYYAWKNTKSSYNNNKFKISAPTWNNKFELPDGSYSVSYI